MLINVEPYTLACFGSLVKIIAVYTMDLKQWVDICKEFANNC
jgi:hypothetical protein